MFVRVHPFLRLDSIPLQKYAMVWVLAQLFGYSQLLSTKHNISVESCSKESMRAGEMAQQLRALATFLEVLSSIPSNHMMAHNHL